MSDTSQEFNAFSELQYEPRPWMERADIDARFHAASIKLEEDKNTEPEHAERLNRARRLLVDHAARIRQLLAVCGYRVERSNRIPEHLAQAGFEVEPVIKAADELLRDYSKGVSRIEQALLADQVIDCQQQLLARQQQLHSLQESAEQRLRNIDHGWSGSLSEELGLELAQLADELTYLERWHQQIAKRLHRFQVEDRNF